MSERQRQTGFLKTMMGFGDTPLCHDLEERLQKAERDENSVRRKICGLVLLALLSLIGLGYTRVFVPVHFSQTWHLLVKFFSALGLGALIGLVLFLGCWCWYRALLNSLREEARRLIQTLLPSRLESAGRTNQDLTTPKLAPSLTQTVIAHRRV